MVLSKLLINWLLAMSLARLGRVGLYPEYTGDTHLIERGLYEYWQPRNNDFLSFYVFRNFEKAARR